MGKTGKKKEKKKRKKRSQVFHCVHSDTLYVKNRRNKSEEKKNKVATVKNPRVKKNM